MNLHVEGVSLMSILVVLKNGNQSSIPDYLLAAMIEAGEVTSILRSEGWVKIGVDTVRKGEIGFCYCGPERRTPKQERLCFACPNFITFNCIKEVCPFRYTIQ